MNRLLQFLEFVLRFFASV